MPIKFSFKRLPVDADGKSYDSLEAFQEAELSKLTSISAGDAEAIVAMKDEVIEILELTMDARPAARGQKRPRKGKSPAASEPAPTETPQA